MQYQCLKIRKFYDFSVLKAAHIIAGAIALLVLFIPMLTKKGGNVHRKVGWVFVAAMAVGALTAVAMTIITLVEPSSTPSR